MAQQTPWAILLCKWSDQDAEPESVGFFERLFTPAGAGTRNMVEHFDLMSHGTLDVSGSQVFGWLTMPRPQSDYAGNVMVAPEGQINRQGLVDLARATAITNGVDLTRFWGVVVCTNTATDLFGGGGPQAVCGPGSFEPAVLGQEMGHGYGLDHSRRAGSTEDYQDPWDVMSTWNSCHMAVDSDYSRIGPGLNAANMRGRGWLDESRVWTSRERDFTETIELRPLHRRDLPGFLAAQVGGYLVEFRVAEAWDAAIPRAAVLVHSFDANSSNIHPGNSGAVDLVTGDAFESGDPSAHLKLYVRVEVQGIDPRGLTATLQVAHRFPQLPPTKIGGDHGTPWVDGGGFTDLGQLTLGGGGLIVVGGRTVQIAPGDSAIVVLEHLAAAEAVGAVRDTAARNSIRKAAMQELALFAESGLQDLEPFETPPAEVEKAPTPTKKTGRSKQTGRAKRTGGSKGPAAKG